MKTNYHTHTTRCQHAFGSDEEYVQNAIEGGYSVLGFSDHAPWPFEGGYISPIRMTVAQLDEYATSIHRLKSEYSNKIEIKLGLESEYFPAHIAWLKEQKERLGIDYLIFGNHFYPMEVKYTYFGSYTHTVDMLELYCESAIEGMESGLFSYFAHPDLFMRCYPRFDEHCERITRQICKRAKQLEVPLEYNVSALELNEKYELKGVPYTSFWKIAAEEGCKAIIGIDAHESELLNNSKLFQYACCKLEEFGIYRVERLLI